MQSVVSVRLFSLYLSNQLTFSHDHDLCMCVGYNHTWPGVESQESGSKANAKIYELQEYLLRCSVNIDWWPLVSFHCGVISCELAQRGVRRGAAEVSGSD